MTAGMNTSLIPISGGHVPDGPLSEHPENYRAKMEANGYTPETIRHKLRLVVRLDRWLAGTRQRLRDLNEEVVDRFLNRLRSKYPHLACRAVYVLRNYLNFLREAGAIAPKAKAIPYSPVQRVADDYRLFLKEEQGLDGATIYNYSRHVDRFLSEPCRAGHKRLNELQARDVQGFIQRDALRFNRGHTLQVITGLRSFLRFARYRGYIKADLAIVLPAVARWKLAGLPKPLPKGAVQRVLDHCGTNTVNGKRNYAILLLLSRLGLRAGEVVGLRLEDIDWDNAEITVRSKKGDGWARMPLLADVGGAIARYLKARPRCSCRHVFARSHAPYMAVMKSCAISTLARKALKQAGVKSARTGAHVFRHTLATELLRNGAALGEIGQILRHKHPDTTAIYAKVDIEALRQLALPWPGGGQ